MSNKTRKRLSPALLVMSVAVMGVLAALIALAAQPGDTAAHGPNDHTGLPACEDMTTAQQSLHDSVHDEFGQDGCPDVTPTPTPPPGGGSNVGEGSATKPFAPTMMSISRATDNQGQPRPVLEGDGKLEVDWDYPNDGGSPITGHDLRYTMTPANDDSWHSVNNLPAGKTSYVIMGLTNGETYYVEVRAKNRLGNSSWSARRSGTPVATPSMPMQLSVADRHYPGIVVSWDAPSSSGDHPIDQYNWDVEDMATNGRDSYGTFGSRRDRMMDPPMFSPERGGASTTMVADYGMECLEVTVSASNATDDDPDGRTRSLPGDEATVTCAGAPTLTKQMVDNVAILRWDAPSKLGGGTEVTEYVVRRTGYERITDTHTSTPGPMVAGESRQWSLDGSERSMWDTGLSHQTIYMYTIYAITDRYDLGYRPYRYSVSSPITVFTSTDGGLILAPPSPPTAPRSLETMDQCDQQITLSWMPPSNFGGGVDVERNREWSHGKIVVSEAASIEKYDVQYRERGRGAWMDLSAMGTEAAVTSDLEFGKTYDFRVRAKNNIGLYGPWAMVSRELVTPDSVSAPSNLRATLNEEGDVVLQWTAPQGGNQEWFVEDDADITVNNGDLSLRLSYRVERVDAANMDTDNFGMPTQKHQYGPRSFDDPRITHEQTRTDPNPYDGNATYVVTALVDDCLPSEGNSVTLDTQISMPGSPGNVSATASGDMITVTWTAPSEAGSVGDRDASITGYDVERSTMSGSGFMSVASGHSGTSYTDMGLDYDTTYYYRVIAVNSFGAKSEMSAEASATTAAETLGMATNLSIGINNGGTIQVSWDAASNAAGYIVIAIHKDDNSATSGSVNVLADGTVPTTLNLSGLTVGDDYYVYVATTGSAGDNTLSEPVEVTAN